MTKLQAGEDNPSPKEKVRCQKSETNPSADVHRQRLKCSQPSTLRRQPNVLEVQFEPNIGLKLDLGGLPNIAVLDVGVRQRLRQLFLDQFPRLASRESG